MKKQSTPQALDTIIGGSLNANNRLRNIYEHSSRLFRLHQQLHNILDPSLRNCVWVTDFDDGEMTLLSDSPVKLEKLRFQTRFLQSRLSTIPDFVGLRRIKLKIAKRPIAPSLRPLPKKAPSMPPEAVLALQRLSEASTNSALKKVLTELCKQTPFDRQNS